MLSFVAVALLTLVAGIVGIYRILAMSRADKELYSAGVKGLSVAAMQGDDYYEARVAIEARKSVLRGTEMVGTTIGLLDTYGLHAKMRAVFFQNAGKGENGGSTCSSRA